MPCYHPLSAWQCADGSVIFVERKGDAVRSLTLPCGRCIGCRLERSRQWALRCVHEAKCHDRNCFVTLTFDDAHAPRDMSLDYSVFQKFMKRLRKSFSGETVRFYMCGEYGETFGRPHYHVCLFGIDFDDKVLISGTAGDDKALYRSERLGRLWPFGFSSIGAVTFESAAYVARYVMKKVTGDMAKDHYRYVDLETGEIYQRTPEFCKMSLRPGIGAFWLDKFSRDVYPRDYVVSRGTKAKPPRYYDVLYSRREPLEFEYLQYRRTLDADKRRDDNTLERLAVREECAKARLNQFKRSLD